MLTIGKKEETYSLPIWLGRLPTTEVAESPSCISKHTELTAVAQESKQWPQCTSSQDKVSAMRAVTSDVSQRPNSLLANIRLMTAEKFDEDRYSSGVDDNLSLLC